MFSEGPIDALCHFRLGHKLLRNHGVTKPLLDTHNAIVMPSSGGRYSATNMPGEGVARYEDVDESCQEHACAKL